MKLNKRNKLTVSLYSNYWGPKARQGLTSVEELVQIPILQYADRWFRIVKSLSTEDRVEILLTLVQNLDVFA